jgi:hypothetical protein
MVALGLFLSRIGDMKEEEFTKAFYTNLLSSITASKEDLAHIPP